MRNRTPINRRRRPVAVSPHAVKLFRELVRIEKLGAHETWEDEGGQRRHYFDLDIALNQGELGLAICDHSVMDVAADDQTRPGDVDFKVVRWRRQLEAAARLAD
jgi:hypothetical protein